MTESLVGKVIDGHEVTSDENTLWTEIDRSKKIIVADTERNCHYARTAFGRYKISGSTEGGGWCKDLSPIWYARDYKTLTDHLKSLKGELSGVISGIYFPYEARASDSGAINCPIGLRVIAELTKSKIPFVLTGLDAENKPQDAFWLFEVINNLAGHENWSFNSYFVHVWRYAGNEENGWRKAYCALLKRIEEVKVKP